MRDIEEASRIELGYQLLDLNEDQADEPIDGFHLLKEEEIVEDDDGTSTAKPVQVDPAYEVDYLQAMVAKEDVLKNMVQQSGAEHEAILETLRMKNNIAVCRHRVQNKFWRPGKPVFVEVGQAVLVGIAGPKETKPLAKDHQPKSFVGCLRAGMNKQQAREYLNACQKVN